MIDAGVWLLHQICWNPESSNWEIESTSKKKDNTVLSTMKGILFRW